MSCKSYLNQSFKDIKSECLRTGVLFRDEKFPPCDKSINVSYKKNSTQTAWIRARDLCSNPRFIIDGIKRGDLNQGDLGDCWFIAAIAAICEISEYRQKVIPDDQDFDKDYCGLFHFRFWQKGVWLDVVVDDFLPVDENGKLLYLSNTINKNEFWSPLLEKAYAKLYYCYELLEGGMEEDSLTDMTGGVAEFYDFSKLIRKQKNIETKSKNTKSLWRLINKSFKMDSVCNISIWPKDENSSQALQLEEEGLVHGHAYTVTGMDEQLRLIRIRNPYGKDGDEWNGDWSDKSKKWNSLDYETKKRLNFVKGNDGEFWMSFDDCILRFDRISFVHLNLNAFTDQQQHHSHWDFKQISNEWKRKDVKNFKNHFWSNPQHVLNLIEIKYRTQVIIALMSTDYNERRKNDEEYATIMFHLFKVRGNFLKTRYNSKELKRVGKSNKLEGEREVTKRFTLQTGIYVIIPSIVESDYDTKYLLRIFNQSNNNVEDFDDYEEEDYEEEEEEEEEENECDEEDEDENEYDDDDEEEEEEEEKPVKSNKQRKK